MAIETTEQIVREAPDIEAYKLGLLQSAKALADQGITIPPQMVAEMSGLQIRAGELAEAGIGGYQPYLQEAGYTLGDAQTALGGAMAQALPYQAQARDIMAGAIPALGAATQQAYGAAQQGIGGLYAATGAYQPSAAQAFMSPYEDAAVQQAIQDIARSGQMERQNLAARAVGQGAFGGSRQAVAEQELNRNVLEQQGRTAAQMRAAGYQQAAQQAQQAFEQQQARLQQAGLSSGQLGLSAAQFAGQAAGQAGQLGQGIGALGAQYGQLGIQQGAGLGTLGLQQASLGELGQQIGQKEQAFLFDLGKQQQAQQQAALEAARSTQLQQLYEPYQRIGFLSDIYKGAPTSQQTLTAASTPNVSPAQQILGMGIAGLSAAAGAQKVGLFG